MLGKKSKCRIINGKQGAGDVESSKKEKTCVRACVRACVRVRVCWEGENTTNFNGS